MQGCVRQGFQAVPKVYHFFLLDICLIIALPKSWVRFGMASTPAKHSGMVRYDLDTGTRHVGKFDTPTKNIPGTGTPYRTHPCNVL